jgi:hypothetical protein
MPDEKEADLDYAKTMSVFEGHRRRVYFSQGEANLVKKDCKTMAIAMFSIIVQKYAISKEDAAVLLECIPFMGE